MLLVLSRSCGLGRRAMAVAPWAGSMLAWERELARLKERLGQWSSWGRVIFYVADVDELYEHALAAGFSPAMAPRDAEWGERYFHLTDRDGHELSFARPLPPRA